MWSLLWTGLPDSCTATRGASVNCWNEPAYLPVTRRERGPGGADGAGGPARRHHQGGDTFAARAWLVADDQGDRRGGAGRRGDDLRGVRVQGRDTGGRVAGR